VKDWTDRATAYRYPDENAPPEPDVVEIQDALDIIDRLAVRLRAANPASS
jgi:hypothetical protein